MSDTIQQHHLLIHCLSYRVLHFGMQRWRVLIDGKHSGRLRSVMAPNADSARQKAIDFYEIEPTLVRVIPIQSHTGKPNPRALLDHLWHRRPESLV